MAAKPNSTKSSMKVNFGKRRIGRAVKRLNKHKSPGSKNRGQG